VTQRGVPRSGVWSEGNDCVERNRSERTQVASVAERKPPARNPADSTYFAGGAVGNPAGGGPPGNCAGAGPGADGAGAPPRMMLLTDPPPEK
jgi:hypothetical protein